MKATRWISADELHFNLLTLTDVNTAIIITLLSNKADNWIQIILGQRKVNKAWSGNLSFFNRSAASLQMFYNCLSNLARVTFCDFGQLHSSVRSQITVCLISWYFQYDIRNLFRCNNSCIYNCIGNGFFYPFIH
ncbi:hypothetical protein D3C71_1260320 [compost metagenome]